MIALSLLVFWFSVLYGTYKLTDRLLDCLTEARPVVQREGRR